MVYLIFDGNLIPANQAIIKAGNRGFRYGDGLFETMKMLQGSIQLFDDHIYRLHNGMRLLAFDTPGRIDRAHLRQQILELCEKNHLSQAARIRLMVFRGSGSLYDGDNKPFHYIIEASPLPENAGQLNQQGYITGIYIDARKQIDHFSGLKANNYLPYTMGAVYARQQGWNDCLLLNTDDAICESTIANVFIVKDGIIFTPSLDQGCVAGVMRKYLLRTLPELGYTVREAVLTPEMVRSADEMFLTNAVQGIRWVRQFGGMSYQNNTITRIYKGVFPIIAS